MIPDHFGDFPAVGIAAVAALIGTPALAADMAVEALPPVSAPVYSWTGWYIGGDLGWFDGIQSRNCCRASFHRGLRRRDYGYRPPRSRCFAGQLRPQQSGVVGGVHAGYNWQTARWLTGVEANFSLLDRNGNNTRTIFENSSACCLGPMQVSATNHWLASFSGRVGWIAVVTTGCSTLPGAPLGRGTTYSANFASAIAPDFPTANTSFSQTKTGFVVGAGVELKIAAKLVGKARILILSI